MGKVSSEKPCSQIMVRMASDGPKEWTIIELQGEFETRDSSEGCKLDNLEIGKLSCKDGSNSAQLIIGNQRLDGKITELKQPLAVLSKVNRLPAHEASDGGDTAMEAEAKTIQTSDGMSQMEFQITGLIKRKIVFNHRPTIVTHHPSPSKDLGSQRFV